MKRLVALCCLVASVAGAFPVSTNEISVDVSDYETEFFRIPQGELRYLLFDFEQDGVALDLSGLNPDLLYQGGSMTNWASITGTVVNTSQVLVPWGPDYDPGYLRYTGWLRLRDAEYNPGYRLKVDLRMIKTPGFVVNPVSLSTNEVLDWSQYTEYSSVLSEGPVRADLVTIGVTTNSDGSVTLYSLASPPTLQEVTDAGATTTGDVVVASLQLSGGDGTQGALSWNADEETLDLIENGSVLQVGQEFHVPVKNRTGSTISDGTLVGFVGTEGASGNILVAPYIADGSMPAEYVLGFVTYDITNGGFGKVTSQGKVRGFDTSANLSTNVYYASTTVAGGVQTNAPSHSEGLKLPVAAPLNVKANGTIYVRVTPIDLNSWVEYDDYISAITNAATIASVTAVSNRVTTIEGWPTNEWSTAYSWGDWSAAVASVSNRATDLEAETNNYVLHGDTRSVTLGDSLELGGDLNMGGNSITNVSAITASATSEFGANVSVADNITHLGDPNTYISFGTDQMAFYGGGVSFLSAIESTEDRVVVNPGAVDMNFKIYANGDADAFVLDGASGDVAVKNNLEVVGNINSSGSVTAATVTATGALTAGSLTTAGTVSAEQLTSTDDAYVQDRLSVGSSSQVGTLYSLGKTGESAISARAYNASESTAIYGVVASSGSDRYLLDLVSTAGVVMRVLASGNVGIGTNAPSQKLHVVGNGLFTGTLGVDGAATVGSLTSGEVTVSGNVAIEKPTPVISIDNTATSSQSVLLLKESGVNKGGWIVYGSNHATTGLREDLFFKNYTSAGDIQFGTAGGNAVRLFIDGDGGNVGIGTTTPSEKLHVVGNGLFTGTLGVDGAATVGSNLTVAGTAQAASFSATNYLCEADFPDDGTQTIPETTWTVVTNFGINECHSGLYTATSSNVTVLAGGSYRMDLALSFEMTAGAAANFSMHVYTNGAAYTTPSGNNVGWERSVSSSASDGTVMATKTLTLNADDVVDWRIYTDGISGRTVQWKHGTVRIERK